MQEKQDIFGNKKLKLIGRSWFTLCRICRVLIGRKHW